MPQHLTDLTVDRVSLVDRPAIRDPHNPTKPRSFIFWKAEDGHVAGHDDMVVYMATSTYPLNGTAAETQLMTNSDGSWRASRRLSPGMPTTSWWAACSGMSRVLSPTTTVTNW